MLLTIYQNKTTGTKTPERVSLCLLSINTLKFCIYGWADERKNQARKGAHKRKKGTPKEDKNAVCS
jgi:hypothetical protein